MHTKEQRLDLRRGKKIIYIVNRWGQKLSNVARPRIMSPEGMKSMAKTISVCKASLDDINKALRVKPKLSLKEAYTCLSEQIKDYAHLFADNKGAEELPPLKGPLDHSINLREESRKPLTPTQSTMYSISREKLLVFRKTLTDLLKKGCIRPSHSSAAAPVLFVKKKMVVYVFPQTIVDSI